MEKARIEAEVAGPVPRVVEAEPRIASTPEKGTRRILRDGECFDPGIEASAPTNVLGSNCLFARPLGGRASLAATCLVDKRDSGFLFRGDLVSHSPALAG